MVELFFYDGIPFRRHPNAKANALKNYYKKSISGKTVYLHRYMYEKQIGEIPEGYEIHHFDGNPLNNKLYNLVLTEKNKHREEHSRQKQRCARGTFIGTRKRTATERFRIAVNSAYRRGAFALRAAFTAVKKLLAGW